MDDHTPLVCNIASSYGMGAAWPEPEIVTALFERLVAGDPLARLEFIAAVLDPLVNHLRVRYRNPDDHLCITAAEDAVLSLIRNPATYDPSKRGLIGYLRMSAEGDILNLLQREEKHRNMRETREFFTATPGSRYPEGGHWINSSSVNRRLAPVLERLGLPAGREFGFVVHSLRDVFETYAVNANIPQRVIDTWLGHRSDKSMGSVYYRLLDRDSQDFMAKLSFEGRAGPELRDPPPQSSES